MSINYKFEEKAQADFAGKLIICYGHFKHKNIKEEVMAAEQLCDYDNMSKKEIDLRKKELVISCDTEVARYIKQ